MADASPAAAPVWDDLRSFDRRPWRGRVHIVTAGYPCQPFSLAGNRPGAGDPRHLWPDVARIVRETGPAWCFSGMSRAICPAVSITSPETFRAWAAGVLRASYQRRKSAHRTSASGCSFRPTPTFRSAGNRACIRLGPERGLEFRTDQNQTGSQIGLRNAVLSWTLMWQLLQAAGWTPGRPASSHRCRVILLNGERYSEGTLTLNPAFSDWMMGCSPGLTDPLRPATGWSAGCGTRVAPSERRTGDALNRAFNAGFKPSLKPKASKPLCCKNPCPTPQKFVSRYNRRVSRAYKLLSG